MDIPKSFLIGVGDADWQVVGEDLARAAEHSEQTMIDYYGRSKPTLSPPGVGVDRYYRFREDVALIQKLGFEQYRCSVSMSRTLHQDGTPNEAALAWYDDYFKTLKAAGLTIHVTLYHGELPQFLSATGGWKNRDTCDWLVRHAKLVYERFNQYIETYFILNEPWSTISGYTLDLTAPGESSLAGGLLAAHHQLLAQGMVVAALDTLDSQLQLSTIVNRCPFYALHDSASEKQAVKLASGILNDWFLDPVYFGKYPQETVEFYGDAMPSFDEQDLHIMQVGQRLNSIGINYYFGSYVDTNPDAVLGYQEIIPVGAERTGMGWNVTLPPLYPEGLKDLLHSTFDRYEAAGLKNILISENGMGYETAWDGASEVVEDPKRVWYLQQHLMQVLEAKQEGVPIMGYFVWTLMDNFESCSEAYTPGSSFGIVHIERADASLKRVPKHSALMMQEINRTRKLQISGSSLMSINVNTDLVN